MVSLLLSYELILWRKCSAAMAAYAEIERDDKAMKHYCYLLLVTCSRINVAGAFNRI